MPAKQSPSRVTSPTAIRSAGQPYSIALASDLEGLSQNINSLALSVDGIQSGQRAGLSVAVTVRNAAGTGTSTLVFTNGLLTSYTP